MYAERIHETNTVVFAIIASQLSQRFEAIVFKFWVGSSRFEKLSGQVESCKVNFDVGDTFNAMPWGMILNG